MSQGGHFQHKKYSVLYRIVRCLDCPQMPIRGDNDRISLMTTQSELNDQIRDKVRLLDDKGHSLDEICQELKFLYGNHVIANKRDRFRRSQFDY